MNMITDTHSHLNFKNYDKDREDVIKRAKNAGIVCIDVGVDFKTSEKSVELAEKHDNIFAAIGIHPSEINEEFNYKNYKKLALSDSRRVVAIGEIGLDYFRNKDEEKQKQIFMQQLILAQELNLPVIIHCRDAHADLINILKNYNLNGVVHCFTGTVLEMWAYLDSGFYIGINGIIFKQNLDEVVKNCPLDKILTETDCPFLGIQKRNEPIFVKEVINKIAELKKMNYQKIAEQTYQNAKQLFKI